MATVGLLWFEGIGWDTSVRDIGWTYVLMGLAFLAAAACFALLWLGRDGR